jgi:hypothetical protein
LYKVPSKTFREWLRLQERRDDSIGDLARDVATDRCLGKRRAVGSIREHLVAAHTPIDAALDTLDRAGQLWKYGGDEPA